MIAMISSGKTSILKVLFDLDILESSSGITTKFVTIIRYNPKVKNCPKFYHLKIKKNEIDNYSFSKIIGSEVLGYKNIKTKIIEINDKLKNTNNIQYDELFYFLEIGNDNFIEDKKYLENYDLVDIPGVSEFQGQQIITEGNSNEDNKTQALTIIEETIEDLSPPEAFQLLNSETNNSKNGNKSKTIEEEMLTYDPEKEENYLTKIFKIIKNKMRNGIFVFNIENYQYTENYRIIGKLQKVLNKPIENFLIILNKIDKSLNVEYDLKNLGNKILEYFPNAELFNITKNIIVPCCTFQLENELKMNKDFKNLIYYHFLNFLINHKKTSNNMTPNINSLDFLDYLKKLLLNLNNKIDKELFYNKINKIINNKDFSNYLKQIKQIIEKINEMYKDNEIRLDLRADDFDEKEIKKIKKIINKNKENTEDGEENEEEEEEKEDFNIGLQKNNMIILYYYSEFLEKNYIPPKSKETKKIIDFFSMKNMEKNHIIEKEVVNEVQILLEDEKTYDNNITDLSNRLKQFYEKYEKKRKSENDNNLKSLGIYINSSIGILKNTKNFYIPLLGLSNSGKSTVLNSIIGTSILPTKRTECTKKGILIRYWNKNYAIIRKTKFVKELLYTGKYNYRFISQEKIIAKGEENIRKILEGVNGKFTNNEEEFFYEINIKINMIDKMIIDNKLKEKICFIDLPGFGTNNPFEDNDTYSHLIQSCNLFLFVVFNLKILENDNHKMLKKLYMKMAEYRNIPTRAFINKCLFIINFEQTLEINDKIESQARKDILKVIELNNQNIDKELKVCFLNAKYYEDYNFKLKYYSSIEFLFEYEFKNYNESIENYWKGIMDKIKGKSFIKYIQERLKENIRKDITKKYDNKKIIIPSEISDLIKKIITNKKCYEFNEANIKKEIEKIEKYLAFSNNEIKNSDLIKKSNSESFSNYIFACLLNTNNKEEKDIKENINEIFKNLSFIFEVSYDDKFEIFKEAPKSNDSTAYIDENIKKFKNKVKYIKEKIDYDYSNCNIKKIFSNYLNQIKKSLEEKKSIIEEDLKNEDWQNIQNNFEQIFTSKLNFLKKELLDKIEDLSNQIKNNFDEFHKTINEIIPCESSNLLLKNFISKRMGRDNDIEESINDIIFDIISQSKSCTDWKNSQSFFKWFKAKIIKKEYLNQIIDFMIDNSCLKLKKSSDTYSNLIEDFKVRIENEINCKKDKIIEELESKKYEENKKIQIKNEKQRRKWEEDKSIYEEKKKQWKELCKEFKQLREEFFSLKFDKNN